MQQPLISIVTVCYNAKTTIECTIRSVLKQNYPKIEYIIIDGGSLDGTVEIINKYRDRLAYFISERDKGIYDAMNKGIKVATGEWIIFRNSGDYFASEDAVSKMFTEKVKDDIIVLHGDCRGFDEYGYKDNKPPMECVNYTLNGIPVLHPSSFIRLSYHKKHLFDLRYRSSADFDFFLKCTLNGCHYEYRSVLVSVMNVGAGMSVDNLNVVWRENYELLCENGVIVRSIKSKALHYKTYYSMRFRHWIKKIMPRSYVAAKIIKNKLALGWVIGEDPIPSFISEG